ncbi:hypothetical protein QSV34_01170 [Porticoccus sp. W117]|uniref:hypothetical protein n=1 Tax=Porticoccus sp. W117 TaxID=3054777 RepID=UPI0025998672|nr:hypothetical protein [Porticoccus sp. W117]MDM3869956.1 hypothetical protein [Porticoccus sp. W117]
MYGTPDSKENTEIPVLETPAADMVTDQLLDELDIPILTTPAADVVNHGTDAPQGDNKTI